MIFVGRLDTASDWLIANLGTMKKSDVDFDGKLSQKSFLRSSCPQQSADVCQQETPPDTWHLLAKCHHKRRPVGKSWTGRFSNHDKTKEVEMDRPYLEEREEEHH